MINCTEWVDIGKRSFGKCKLNLFGGRPSLRICEQCDRRTSKVAGESAFVTLEVSAKPAPEKKSAFGPGDLVKLVLMRMGYTSTAKCGCKRMQRQMNDWGWLGCSTIHRAEIVRWFSAKAKESGLNVPSESMWGLIVAAWNDVRARRQQA